MKIEDVRTPGQMRAFEEHMTMQRIHEKIPKEDSHRMVYTTLVLNYAATDYIEAAISLAIKMRLKHQSVIREIRQLIADGRHNNLRSLGSDQMNELLDKKDELFDKGDSSFVNIWNIVRKKQDDFWPGMSADHKTFFSNLSMAYILLLASVKSEERSIEQFHRLTGLHLCILDDSVYKIIQRVKVMGSKFLVNPTPMMLRSMWALVKKGDMIREQSMTIKLKS